MVRLGRVLRGCFLSKSGEMCKLEETKQKIAFVALGVNKKKQTQEHQQTVKYPQFMFGGFNIKCLSQLIMEVNDYRKKMAHACFEVSI